MFVPFSTGKIAYLSLIFSLTIILTKKLIFKK